MPTDSDLAELTGYTRPADQRKALERHGIRYVLRPDGRPRTTWDAVTAALTGAEARTLPRLDKVG